MAGQSKLPFWLKWEGKMNTFEIKGFNQKVSKVLKYFPSEKPSWNPNSPFSQTSLHSWPAQATLTGALGQEGKMIIFEIRALIQKIPKALN